MRCRLRPGKACIALLVLAVITSRFILVESLAGGSGFRLVASMIHTVEAPVRRHRMAFAGARSQTRFSTSVVAGHDGLSGSRARLSPGHGLRFGWASRPRSNLNEAKSGYDVKGPFGNFSPKEAQSASNVPVRAHIEL